MPGQLVHSRQTINSALSCMLLVCGLPGRLHAVAHAYGDATTAVSVSDTSPAGTAGTSLGLPSLSNHA